MNTITQNSSGRFSVVHKAYNRNNNGVLSLSSSTAVPRSLNECPQQEKRKKQKKTLTHDKHILLTTGHLSSFGMPAGLATRTRTPPLGFPPLSLLFLLLPLVPSPSSRHGIAHTAIPP